MTTELTPLEMARDAVSNAAASWVQAAQDGGEDTAITNFDAAMAAFEEAIEEEYRDEVVHSVALEVLCRVFNDGADEGYQEWLAWYNPASWLHPSRGLGAFINERIERKGGGLILATPERECPTCHGPRAFPPSGVKMFDGNCPAAWAHRFVRSASDRMSDANAARAATGAVPENSNTPAPRPTPGERRA